MFKLKSNSAEQTIDFAKKFSKTLKEKDVFILEGALGGGKTTFVRGVLEGLGYKGKVLSPTFTLVRKYDLKKISVYHLDLYRLKFSDLYQLGIDDFLYSPGTITLIEWGDKIKESLQKYLRIEFLFKAENRRDIKFSNYHYSKERLQKIQGMYR